MRKIYLTFAILLAFGWASAQQAVTSLNAPANKKVETNLTLNSKAIQSYFNTKNSKASNRWYNYGFAVDNFNMGTAEWSGNYLFPDSTILVNYSTSYGGPWLHKLGDVLDVNSEMFNDDNIAENVGELHMSDASSYVIDSIEIWGIYWRGASSPNATDKIRINVALKSRPYGNGFSYFGPTSAVAVNLKTDTVKMLMTPYTQSSNSFGITPNSQFEVDLTAATENDTNEMGLNYVKIAANITVPSGKIPVLSYEFIPGYTWSANTDTITNFNRWRFLSLNEGAGVFPLYTKGDYNMSSVIPQDVRYNDAGGWNGYYIPSFAYMGGSSNDWDYVHHAIFYLCHETNTGINNSFDNSINTAYPNPVSKGSDLVIKLSSKSDIVITDVVGKVVNHISAENINDGKAVVNTSDLTPGVYFYTVNKLTKKFVVVE